jgi:hypothetical protein
MAASGRLSCKSTDIGTIFKFAGCLPVVTVYLPGWKIDVILYFQMAAGSHLGF